MPALFASASDKLKAEVDDATKEVETWTNAKEDPPVEPTYTKEVIPKMPPQSVFDKAREDDDPVAAQQVLAYTQAKTKYAAIHQKNLRLRRQYNSEKDAW